MFLNWRYLAKGNLSDFIKAERENKKLEASQKLLEKGEE